MDFAWYLNVRAICSGTEESSNKPYLQSPKQSLMLSSIKIKSKFPTIILMNSFSHYRPCSLKPAKFSILHTHHHLLFKGSFQSGKNGRRQYLVIKINVVRLRFFHDFLSYFLLYTCGFFIFLESGFVICCKFWFI